MHATCFIYYINICFITLMMFGEGSKLWSSSLCTFSRLRLLPLFGLNMPFSNLFSSTVNSSLHLITYYTYFDPCLVHSVLPFLSRRSFRKMVYFPWLKCRKITCDGHKVSLTGRGSFNYGHRVCFVDQSYQNLRKYTPSKERWNQIIIIR
jgi:hypothetical protein